jgi:hypothetical protein
MGQGVIILVVVGVILLIVADYFFRQRHQKPKQPECSLDDAWNHYLGNSEKWSARDRRAIEHVQGGKTKLADKVKASMQTTIDKTSSAAEPLPILRQAIMDATDRFMLGENVLDTTDPGTDPNEADETNDEYTVSVLEVGALRCYSMLRYGDFDREDWYAHYLRMAEMNSKNVAAMVRKTVEGRKAAFERSLHEPLSQTMRQSREVLLSYPPRTPVQRATKLTTGETMIQRAPTQEQIDQLIDLMSERFEKLFAGQVYSIESGPLVSPASTFQVDAGLLYTALAVEFRQPIDAWRRIMRKSMGPYSEAMENEDRLLKTAQELRDNWKEDGHEGPLHELLTCACASKFELPDGSRPADPNAMAVGMREDAAILVGSIRKVLQET